MMARPALFPVLVCLAPCNDEAWCRAMLGAGLTPQTAWRHESPVEAFEALIAAELLPQHWSDPDRAPRWWCERCRGRGLVGSDGRAHGRAGGWMCDACDSHTHTASPPSHTVLVAIASLGVDAIARAEAIVAQTWRARVVWRVMTRIDLEALLAEALLDPNAPVACRAASALYRRPGGHVDVCAAHFDVSHVRALALLETNVVAVADG